MLSVWSIPFSLPHERERGADFQGGGAENFCVIAIGAFPEGKT